MSENKHTPAPWRAIANTGHVHGPDVEVCTVGDYQDKELLHFNKERWDADTLLIAAAPDLFEAARLQEEAEDIWANCPECQEARSWPELCEHCFESADKARVARMNAIAKARGETE